MTDLTSGTFRPSRLPKIRDQVQYLLGDRGSLLRSRFEERAPADNDDLDHIADCLGHAELYWVTEEMAACAVGSAQRLTHVRWTLNDRPSEYGLVVFDGGIGGIHYQDSLFPCDAVSWGSHPGGLMFAFFTRRSRVEQEVAQRGARLDFEAGLLPPLIPFGGHVEPVRAEPTPVKDLPGGHMNVLTTLAMAWVMMREPRATERVSVDIDRKLARVYTRAGRPVPEVKMVTLRRAYQPTGDAGELDPDRPGRYYRHRWYVPAFPRWQRKGPGLSQLELILVSGHIRGPEGAPMLNQDKVNVWRK